MRFSYELCPFLEPGGNWTKSQLDIEWTSEGTDVFLGHGVATTLRTRSPIGVWCRLESLEPEDGNESRRRRRSDALDANAVLQGRRMGRLYLLTTGGMIGVGRRAFS